MQADEVLVEPLEFFRHFSAATSGFEQKPGQIAPRRRAGRSLSIGQASIVLPRLASAGQWIWVDPQSADRSYPATS